MIDLATLMPIAVALLGICCTALGWFAHQIWNGVKKNEADLNAHKLAVAENYVRHDRLQEMVNPINRMLSDIQTMLAQKADRT